MHSDFRFSQDEAFSVEFGAVTELTPDIPVYDGETVVTPKVLGTTVLLTRDKRMEDDVTVLEVPIHRTGNQSGGMTVHIGRK